MNRLKQLFAKQNLLLAGAVLVAVGVGFGGVYALTGNRQDKIRTNVNCSGICVDLLGDKASPDTLAIKSGSYVTFNSADGESHELTLGDPSTHGHSDPGSFESGVFKADESFKVQFKQDGTYRFTDKLHPKTNIIVVVYTEGKDYKVQ